MDRDRIPKRAPPAGASNREDSRTRTPWLRPGLVGAALVAALFAAPLPAPALSAPQIERFTLAVSVQPPDGWRLVDASFIAAPGVFLGDGPAQENEASLVFDHPIFSA